MSLISKRVAQAKNRNQIRKYTYQLRKDLGLDQTEYFPIMRILENVLPLIYPEFHVEAVEDKELPGQIGRASCRERV